MRPIASSPTSAAQPPRPSRIAAGARRDATPRRGHGFTLLELMVVMALSALVLGLAVPALDGFVARQRLRAASYDLVTDLTLARSESLKRASAVTLAPTGTEADWRGGWTLATATGQVIGQRPAPGGAVRIVNAPARVSFNERGQVDATDTVKFGLSDGRGGERCILLDPAGRPRSLSTACTP